MPQHVLKPWSLPPQKTYIFEHANVVDAASGVISEDQDVKISGGVIQSIRPSTASSVTDWSHVDDVLVDLTGKYLCPGLIDCHVHVGAVAGDEGLMGGGFGPDPAVSYFRQAFHCKEMLSRGFTTVRDAGGATLALKEALADDVFPGPRLFIANKPLSQTGGHGDKRNAHQCCHENPFSAIVDGVPACIQAAREQIRTGADFIKVMISGGVSSPTDKIDNVQFTEAEIRAIAEVTDNYGTWATAHAFTPIQIRHAVDNGITAIEHGNLLDQDTARYMAERGIWLTPTLVTFEAMGSEKYSSFLPPVNQQKNREVLARGLDSLRMAHAAGVKICHGSDLLGPLQAEQSQEFEIRARVLDSKAVLRGATTNAAEMLRQEDVLGQIKEGFAADLLILNENPLKNVAILAKPEKHILAVVKNGRVYTSRWSKLPVDVIKEEVMIE
jgi:imidazolonepropionase-like amidohydrolase